jgi:tRNA A-37 threonylcarbamoyl transferase component Bud32
LHSADCPDANQIGALVEGKLDPIVARSLTIHLDTCPDCQELVAFALRAAESISVAAHRIAPTLDGTAAAEWRAGSRIDRYALVERIGAGATGVVYRAIDPKLERHVALKLVRDETAESRTRLEYEAQLAARLQHPNVVTIYDTGAVGEVVFVSMEYVDGTTLAEWMRTPHDVRAVLDVFSQAARGLAAAHRAGLVHRDFKPSNVLVGTDGRVRLADFGLARRVGDANAMTAPARGSPSEPPKTKSGEMVGTPLYMSPEQHRGQSADASSDQFAFCVALYEALYQSRPFRGATLAELAARVVAGTLEPPPRTARVPSWLREVVARGLSVQRERRFTSMDELAAKLSRGRARRWQRYTIAGVVVAGVAIAGGWSWRAHERISACHDGSARVAAVFDTGVATSIARAFAATGVSFASSSAERANTVLDRYTRELANGAETACLAERDEAPSVIAARRQCFAAHTAALATLVQSLEHADLAIVQRAVENVWESVERAPCADEPALLASAQASRALPAAQVQLLGTAEGLLRAERAKDGIALITPMLEAAKASGDRVAELAASLKLAQLDAVDANGSAAAALLHRVVELAEAQGLDDDAFAAYSLLATRVPTPDDAAARHRYVALARAKLERTKRNGSGLEAKLTLIEAQIDQDEYRFADAETATRSAIDIATRELGEDHPLIGRALGTLGIILRAQNHNAAELDVDTRAVELLQRALGADHPAVAGAQMNLAGSLIAAGKLDDARALLLRADATFTRALGADHPVHGRVLANLADIDKAMGHWDQARQELERALAIVERTAGARSVDAGDVHFELAEALDGANRHDDSLREAARSTEILESALGKDHGQLVSPLLLSAEIDLELHHGAAAIPLAERALAILSAPPGHPANELADARMVLARALWDGGGNRARARSLAEQARSATGDLGGITTGQIDEWLSAHPMPR